MKLPFVPRSVHQAALDEITELRARVAATEARHDEVEGKRRNLARWLAEATATNKRLAGRNAELTRRLEDGTDDERVAQLEARIEELTALAVQANAALEDKDTKLRAAEERARQAVQGLRPEEWESRPVDGARRHRADTPSEELRRALDQCRALAQQLEQLQASHIADTRELHDLRQGAAS